MPYYTYECPLCGAAFSQYLRFSEDPARVSCPNGHKEVKRIYAAPPVVFKGPGYYITDSRPAGTKASG